MQPVSKYSGWTFVSPDERNGICQYGLPDWFRQANPEYQERWFAEIGSQLSIETDARFIEGWTQWAENEKAERERQWMDDMIAQDKLRIVLSSGRVISKDTPLG